MWKIFFFSFMLLALPRVGRCALSCPASKSGTANGEGRAASSGSFFSIERKGNIVQLTTEFTSENGFKDAITELENSEELKGILRGCQQEVSTTIYASQSSTVSSIVPSTEEKEPTMPSTTGSQDTTAVPTTVLPTKKEETSVARSPRPSSIATPTEPQTNNAITMSPTTKFEDTTAVSSTVLTTAEEETTIPPTTESQDTTAEPMTTQMTTPKPCEKYSSNKTCKFIYGEKCFSYVITGAQNVDLEAARQMCTNMGFELGNITEECVFEGLKKHAEAKQEVFGNNKLWTGMSVTAENINDYGRNGEKNAWWYDGNPTEENPIYIRFKKKFLQKPFKMGFFSAPATMGKVAKGAFCEKPR